MENDKTVTVSAHGVEHHGESQDSDSGVEHHGESQDKTVTRRPHDSDRALGHWHRLFIRWDRVRRGRIYHLRRERKGLHADFKILAFKAFRCLLEDLRVRRNLTRPADPAPLRVQRWFINGEGNDSLVKNSSMH